MKKEELNTEGVAEFAFAVILDLIREADFLSLNLAFVPETERFLNEERIQRIKPGAVVINLAPKEATLAKQRMFLDNLENFLKGSPTNKVN